MKRQELLTSGSGPYRSGDLKTVLGEQTKVSLGMNVPSDNVTSLVVARKNAVRKAGFKRCASFMKLSVSFKSCSALVVQTPPFSANTWRISVRRALAVSEFVERS